MEVRTKQTTVFKFGELSERAKQRALENRAQATGEDFDIDAVYDDAVNMGALLGIEINSKSWTNSYGFNGSSPAIYYSGFSSQGDGACFEGSYRYQAGAPKAIKAETSAGRDDASEGDQELLRIAEGLQEIQRRNFYQLTATAKHSGHYQHSGCMSVDVYRKDEKEMTDDAEEEITQLLRDFADWIYSQLENEYEYQTGEEAALETIEANNYDFTKDGEIYN